MSTLMRFQRFSLACFSLFASACSSAPAATSNDAAPPVPLDGSADSAHPGADGDTGCTCPPPVDDGGSVPLLMPTNLTCYCVQTGSCTDAGAPPTDPVSLCGGDKNGTEQTYASCNLRVVDYTNGGGLEGVAYFYDLTGQWVGVSHRVDGPNAFCQSNGATAGISDVPDGCALTEQHSLCPGDGGPADDGGDGGPANDAGDAGGAD